MRLSEGSTLFCVEHFTANIENLMRNINFKKKYLIFCPKHPMLDFTSTCFITSGYVFNLFLLRLLSSVLKCNI